MRRMRTEKIRPEWAVGNTTGDNLKRVASEYN